MADIRINDLPLDGNPAPNDYLAVDGASTRKSTVQNVVNSGAPVASQALAEDGLDNNARMTPLSTKQSIASEVGVTVQEYSATLTSLSLSPPTGAGVSVLSLSTTAEIRDYLDTNIYVESIADLKALEPSEDKCAILLVDGRAGIFVFRSGNYSARVTADPLEGVFIKADSVSAGSGAWVRVFSGPLDIRWFGATQASNPAATTTAIQRALNLARDAGFGRVLVPAGEWWLDKTQTETFQTVAMPAGSQDQYALLIPTGVSLCGEGYKSVLKRNVSIPLWIAIIAFDTGSSITNIHLDGNASEFPYVGNTYGSGGGISVENGTGGSNDSIVINTLWINDTPGYGIGIGWGNQRGLTVKNVFIKGTGSDGIDMKRVINGVSVFDLYAAVLDNITVEDFGKTSTDDAAQAGVDLRGSFTASNIHVRGFGAAAQAGIRMRGGVIGDNAIGARRSCLSNFRVERVSGGATNTYALEINSDDVTVSNGSVDGCSENVSLLLAGVATQSEGVAITNVMSFNALRYGFRVRSQFRGTRLTNCEDVQTAASAGNAGFFIEGTDTKIVSPYIRTLPSLPAGIQIAASAVNTRIFEPTYTGVPAAALLDSGTGTVVYDAGIMSGPNRVIGILDSGAGSNSWVTAFRGVGQGGIVADSSGADADLILSTKGAGFHALGGTKTATTVGAAGGASALPATPLGYVRIKIGGSIRKIPYYND